MLPAARSLLVALADLVYGSVCAGCASVGAAMLCAGCAASLVAPAEVVRPTPCPPQLPPTWAVARYANPVRAVLLAHKEHGRLGLARPLGLALGRAVTAATTNAEGLGVHGGRTFVVPVPSAPESVRGRGHDPVFRMARYATAAARAAGVDARLLQALRHRRRVVDQAGLDHDERWRNLHGALDVRPRAGRLLSGAAVIVVDDVLTTGATIAEAGRAISTFADVRLAAAVVAATVRRMSPD